MIDWKAGTAQVPQCARCTWSVVGKRRIARIKKDEGKSALIASAEHMNEKRPADTQQRAREASADRRRGQSLSVEHRDQMSAGLLGEQRPAWIWGTCRVCRTRTFTRDLTDSHWKVADLAPSRRGPAGPQYRDVHLRCLKEYRAEHGATVFPRPPRHRVPSSADLTETFEITVVHLRPSSEKQMKIGAGLRDEGDDLAAVIGLTPRATRERMKSFVSGLPTDDRGGAALTTIAATLYRVGARKWGSITVPDFFAPPAAV